MNRRKIIISGGGIAGLTAALCMANAGNRVSVYERTSALQPIGAGIQISPNAFHVLKELGLGEKIIEAGTAPNAILMMNALNGKQLSRIPLGFDIHDIYGAPYIVIHRADLQKILFEACEKHHDISVSFGTEIIDAALHDNGATVLINSDLETSEETCDVLIGADGIHSRLRQDVLELPMAKYTGKIAWRALVPANQVKMHQAMDNTIGWLGPKAHGVTYPVQNGNYLNIVVVTQEADQSTAQAISRTDLLQGFSHWCDEFKTLLELEENWTGWPIYETRDISRMVYRNVALIGDAAHAMVPFAAQGAAQAIEDATVLADCLTKIDTVEEALKAFEAKRLSRVRLVTKTARKNGRIYHLTGIPAFLRNIGMMKIPGDRLLRKLDWIYRWKP